VPAGGGFADTTTWSDDQRCHDAMMPGGCRQVEWSGAVAIDRFHARAPASISQKFDRHFRALAATVSPKPLDTLFDTWLFATAVPRLP
jgi:hypothetical protein